MQYKTVVSFQPQIKGCQLAELSNEVNKLLLEGWHLQGNLVVDNGYLYQVMIKPDGVIDRC